MGKISQKYSRWKQAQHYELNWWQKSKKKVSVEFYKNSAEEVRKYLNERNVRINEDTYVLEVGSGMCGILTFLQESH